MEDSIDEKSINLARLGRPGPLEPGRHGDPQPAEVTYTGQVAKGPTSIVKAYFNGDIDAAYDTYKKAFKDPFEIEDSEHEEVDAEIEFKGSGKEGQVKLLQRCKGRTSVTLTIRPE